MFTQIGRAGGGGDRQVDGRARKDGDPSVSVVSFLSPWRLAKGEKKWASDPGDHASTSVRSSRGASFPMHFRPSGDIKGRTKRASALMYVL